MALLEVEALSVAFPRLPGGGAVLSDLSFSLETGQTLGLVGESGCGKSMTALAIMGLLPPGAVAGGCLRLDGRDVLASSEAILCALRGRQAAMVFQEPMTALNPVRTIGAQVAEGPRLHFGLSRAEAEARALRILQRVGLGSPRFSPDLYPHQLSGGQRQRVVIAIAMACQPRLLIADEPTTALDVTIQAQILDLILGLVAEENMGLIMITHDLGVIGETSEEMMVMYAGRVVERGATAAIFARPGHPYTRGLFAARPSVEGAGKVRLRAIPGRVPRPGEAGPACAFAPRCPRRSPRCDNRPDLSTLGPGQWAACHHPHKAPLGPEASP